MPPNSSESVSGVEQAITNTLRSSTNSVRDAFRRINLIRDGRISAEELRVGLQQFNFRLQPEVAEAIVAKYNRDGTGALDYNDFARFYEGQAYVTSNLSASDMSAGRLGRRSAFRASGPQAEVRLTQKQRSEEVRKLIREKLTVHEATRGTSTRSGAFSDLFLKFDTDRSGKLSFDELRAGLSTMGLSITATEVVDLIELLHSESEARTGEIDLYDFFAMLQDPMEGISPKRAEANISQKKQDEKFSQPSEQGQYPRQEQDEYLGRPRADSKPHLRKLSFMKDGPGVDPNLPESPSVQITAEEVIGRMVSVLDSEHLALRQAFKKFDMDGDGTINSDELSSGLSSIGINLNEEQTAALIQGHDVDCSGRLRYGDFVKMVSSVYADAHEEHLASVARPHVTTNVSSHTHPSPGTPAEEYDEPTAQVSWREVVAFVSAHIEKKFPNSRAAFQSFDTDGSRAITKEQFRSAVRDMGMELSKGEVEAVFDVYDTTESGSLKFHEFVHLLEVPKQATTQIPAEFEAGAQQLSKDHQISSKSSDETPVTHVSYCDVLTILIKQRYPDLKAAFKDFDTNGNKSIDKQEFRGAAVDLGLTLSQEEVNSLFDPLKTEALRYDDFVKLFSASEVSVEPCSSNNPKSPHSELEECTTFQIAGQEDTSGISVQTERYSQKVNSENKSQQETEDNQDHLDYGVGLKLFSEKVYKEFELAKAAFNYFDTDGSRTLDKEEFGKGAQKLEVKFSKTQIDDIFKAFDTKQTGALRYHEFVRLLEVPKESQEQAPGGTETEKQKHLVEAKHDGTLGHTETYADGLNIDISQQSQALSSESQEQAVAEANAVGHMPSDSHADAELSQQQVEVEDQGSRDSTQSYHEVLGFVSSQVYKRYSLVKAAFNEFDTDGSKSIDKEEFRKGVQILGMELSAKEVDAVFQVFDTKKTGSLRYHEFVQLLAATKN